MCEIGQSGEFLSRLLEVLLEIGLFLIKDVLKPLVKSVLIPLGLTAATSATVVSIHKNMFGSGDRTLIISNETINDIMKIIKTLEETGLSIKTVSKTIKNEAKKQKGRFLSMLLGTLGACILRNLFTCKSTMGVSEGKFRARQDFQCHLIL